jgi:hypothetical protein
MYYLNLASRNAKTGAIPVATISRATCPTSCPLKGNGCYAESGPLKIHWDAVSEGKRGVSFDEFCEQVSMLPPNQVWRYGQAGDLPGEGDEIDEKMMKQLVKANAGRPVIAYTHKPLSKRNKRILKEAAKNGFQVNLSADSLKEADELAKKAEMPVVVVLPEEYGRATNKGEWSEDLSSYRARMTGLPTTTPGGQKIAVCPATYTDVTCGECLVCATKRKDVVVGFPAHGSQRKKIGWLKASAS